MHPETWWTCGGCNAVKSGTATVCDDCLAELVEARAAIERLEVERDTLAEAVRAYLSQLDYLQNLWSKEGVTNTIAGQARAALASLASVTASASEAAS